MISEDPLNNIGDLRTTSLIDSSTDPSEATAAGSRLEDFNVAGIQPDKGGKEESVAGDIPGCVEIGEKTNSD